MSDDDREEGTLTERANALYWASDTSVNQIAEDLGLSKGSLYQEIRPLPSGVPCPACGEEMVYPNRTSRERGFLTCEDCGLEEEEDQVREDWHRAAAETPDGAVVVTPGSGGADRARRLPPRGLPGRAVVGAALLGLAAGVAVALLVRRD